MTARETSAKIDIDAAAWVARVDRGLTKAEADGLAAWRAQDRRRNGAYMRALGVAARLDRGQALGADYNPARFKPAIVEINRRRLIWGGGLVAAAGIAAISIGVSRTMRGLQLATPKGRVSIAPLSDGSVVTLNTDSRVAVAYSEKVRNVTLLVGEAQFDVAKHPGRPFIVDAGDVQVRAVGTSFIVRHLVGRPTEVIVREGVVDVTRKARGLAPAAKLRLAANEVAAIPVDAPATSQAIAPADLSREMAWRDGMIAFKDTSLAEAAREFARYSDLPIIVGPDLADETVTGIFSAYNPSEFAHTVALSLSLHARVDDGAVHITR